MYTVQHGLSQFEETLVQQAEAKRLSPKQQNQGAGQGTDCSCLQCGIAILDIVPSPLYRAHYHSLSRLQNA